VKLKFWGVDICYSALRVATNFVVANCYINLFYFNCLIITVTVKSKILSSKKLVKCSCMKYIRLNMKIVVIEIQIFISQQCNCR